MNGKACYAIATLLLSVMVYATVLAVVYLLEIVFLPIIGDLPIAVAAGSIAALAGKQCFDVGMAVGRAIYR